MLRSHTKSKMQFWLYRISTILKSFKILYTLPPEKIDAFINSYKIYDHDWTNEDELIKEMGKNYYQEVKKKIIDYYSVLNHLCAIGQVEKMYIPPAMDLSASIMRNQELFEKKMSKDLQISEKDKVLDIGCGRGRIASHIASITKAKVTGINLDMEQLKYARHFAKGNGLAKQCQFRKTDINEIPFNFPDQSFDAIYQVQVFSYAKDLQKLFNELYRILKPGGRIAFLDWVSLDQYNPKNKHHAKLMKQVKPLIGAIGTPSIKKYVDIMKKAGFKKITHENPSIDDLQAPLIENADRFFVRINRLINVCVSCKILPKHFKKLFDRLTKDGEALVEMDRLKLATTCYYFSAEKEK